MSFPIQLSVVIPTLNAGSSLAQTLASLSQARSNGLIGEILVVDGGSHDQTKAVAEREGAHFLNAPRGRGLQLRNGAEAVEGDWLLFLHADTQLDEGWEQEVLAFIANPAHENCAAAFTFALDDNAPSAQRLEDMVKWRCRYLALPYGDQGLLIARSFYQSLGGFGPLVLFEDVDFVRRIGRERLKFLKARAITSAAKWRRSGYVRRSTRNLFCLMLYFFGISPARIALLYR